MTDDRLRILVIDDDEVDRMMVRRALKASGVGADFDEAADGTSGVERLTTVAYDCALVDYRLPDMDGLSIIRAARGAGAATPIIVLTGQGDEQVAVDLMKAGANDYLSKQRLSRDLLSHSVRHVVRLHRAQSEARMAAGLSAESEQRFRTMADTAPVLVWVSDRQGHGIYFNQGWLDFTGRTPEQELGDGWLSSVHRDDADLLSRTYAAAIERREKFQIEFRLRRHDGEFRWMLDTGAPRFLPDGSFAGHVGSCVDITERKRYVVELERAKEAAEAANRAKDQFLAVLSHELRTPLTPILSTVQALESEPALSPELRASIEMIRRNIELESRLIDDLLDLTRIAKGKLEMDLRPVDVHETMNNVLEMCRDEICSKGLRLAVDMGAARRHARADSARLQQVFWNLIKNAVKFTPDGGTLFIRTANSGRSEAGDWDGDGMAATDAPRLRVEVRDTGIGIEPHVLPRIFDAFEQGERSITRRYGGLGLGLAISKALIDMQGGRLTADSAGKGSGSVFVVDLETIEPPSPTAGHLARREGGTPSGAPLSILLVDDHEDTARAMTRLLERRGYRVTAAHTVASALRAFGDGTFDLVISDIGLPDGSGLELMRELRRSRPVPGIALSGFGMDEDVRKSKEAGFHEHLTKPINFQKLQEIIGQVLGAG